MTHIGIVALSKPALGGTFQYTLSTIDALSRIPGNRYTIYTKHDNHAYDFLNIPIVRLPSMPFLVWSFLEARTSFLRGAGLFSEVDVVIAPIYTTMLLASKRPFVFTLHDMQERYFPEYFPLATRIWRALVNRILCKAASGIVCESTYVKQDIIKFLEVEPSKIWVLPAPPISTLADFDLSNAHLASLKQQLSLPDQFILYPAQFFPHKNHMRLIEAFVSVARTYPNCHLLLTGQKRHVYESVMARVRELNMASQIIHLGHLETSALAAVYRLATLVVIPTLFESVSIPIYEAFSLGVPVCASSVTALPEQVGNAAVLFNPFSLTDIAEKLVSTIADEQLRTQLVARGQIRIASMTPDRYANQLDELLSGIN